MPSRCWLEGHLRNYPGAILIVTHDRYFLDNVTSWILELDRGRGIPYEGNYSAWLVQKQKRLLQEGREEEARQRTLEREQEWIASSPKARQAKSKARISAFEKPEGGGEKQTQTAQPVSSDWAERRRFRGLRRKAMGSQSAIDDLTFQSMPGGIRGGGLPQSSGKMPLFRMITLRKARRWQITIGESGPSLLVDQSRDALDAARTSGGFQQPDIFCSKERFVSLCSSLQLQRRKRAEESCSFRAET
jgi:ATPase subunit of ABC transporter with duplicated ATPase domains